MTNVKKLVVDEGIKDNDNIPIKLGEAEFTEYVLLKFPPEMKHIYDRLGSEDKRNFDPTKKAILEALELDP